MFPSPLGASLSSDKPEFPPAQAAAAALQHYGLTGQLALLTSERDVNYRLTTAQGSFVLKLGNPAEPAEVTDFQTRALLHLETAGLPVPRVIPTRDGAAEVVTDRGTLRLLSWLDGVLMPQATASAGLRRSMGGLNARLTLGLQGFAHPAADHVLQWDLKQAAVLRALLADLDPDLRPQAETVLSRFERRVAPALPGLRWQVVHNDLNPHNILVSPDHAQVTGILDFGDMVRTPLVCDLAVAASYQVDPAQPVDSLTDFVGAYHATLPLTGPEADLILDLVETRWLTTLCITAHRAARYPENAPYILRNAPRARAGLAAFAGLDRARATRTLLSALRPR